MIERERMIEMSTLTIDTFLDVLFKKDIISLEQKLQAIEEARRMIRTIENDGWHIDLPVTYDLNQVCKILKKSTRTVYRYLKNKELRAHKQGKYYYVTHEDLTKFMIGMKSDVQ